MNQLPDSFGRPHVYLPAAIVVWIAIWVAAELLLFDGDLVTAAIAGGAGGLAFGLMTYFGQRAR